MSFDEIIARAVELLNRERRLSYRGLKHRLNIDDATLDALKAEIIEAKRLGFDENGAVLVWHDSAELSAGKPLVRSANTGERRQLTVMFCDLVGSTELSQQLDPEELAQLLRDYHVLCSSAVAQFDGYVAQYQGDGILAYFSYPNAHEDDAVRAVRAALDIVHGLERAQRASSRLRARVGIHTGLVVVDEIAIGEGRDLTAIVGEAPNLAARIQQAAAHNTVVISAATYRLVRGFFVCEDLGPQRFKGFAEPVEIYHVCGESSAESRFEAATSAGLTAFVGRREELGLILHRWRLAAQGNGQVVAVGGDAGIGKSRLVHEVKHHVLEQGGLRVEYHCSPYHESSSFYPVINRMQRALRFSASEGPQEKLAKLTAALNRRSFSVPTMLPLLASLLSLPAGEEIAALSPQQRKEKTLDALVSWLRAESEHAPLCVIFEDLQWADPSTLEYLARLLEETATMRALILLTFRTGFAPPMPARAPITQLMLNRMDRGEARQIADSVAGAKPLPTGVIDAVIEHADGVPLFVEELTRTIIESGTVADGRSDARAGFTSLAVPATIHDSLAARLDRLGPFKEIAQIGAALGREFSHDLIAAVYDADEATLLQALDRLVDAQLLLRMGTNAHSRYLFKHALIQEAAYESILKSKRQQYHRHIAQVIEERFSEIARSQPELLARHYRQAALSSQAIRYLQAAAEKAVQRSANLEAITHLRTALALVGSINEAAQRAQQELALQIALGVPLIAMHGFASPQVESAYERARELCQEAGEVPQLFPASWGLWVFYTARGRHQTALELARQCLKIGERGNDEALKLEAHHALGVSLQVLGECRQALSELEQVIALYDPEKHSACAYTFGQDPGVVCRSHAALALWLLGYPDQARRVNAEALRLGEQVGHPYSLAAANNFGAMLHQMCGETAAVREKTEAAIALSTDRQFAFWMHIGRILRGWMLAAHPEDLEGIAEMSAGLKAFESTGAEILKPYFVALLAQAHARAGQPDIGLELLNTAQVTANRNQERWWEAELYRLKGELLLERKSGQAQQNLTEAQQCFSHAIEIARTQDAKGLELRATMSLTRLLSRRGERKKAYAILAPVYDWFTEGFDTADLRDAMEMLKQLSLI